MASLVMGGAAKKPAEGTFFGKKASLELPPKNSGSPLYSR
jgi:hypothetical protein